MILLHHIRCLRFAGQLTSYQLEYFRAYVIGEKVFEQ